MNLDEFYEKVDAGEYRSDFHGIQVKADFMKVHGIENHPKANRLWAIAWEENHSTSISDVVYLAEDLLDLIR